MSVTASYPPPVQRRVLKQEAPGGSPVTLDIVVPSVTQPGVPFSVRVAVLDKKGYPSVECGANVRLAVPAVEEDPPPVSFTPGEPAVGAVDGLVAVREGLWRIEGTCGGLAAVSNPSLCTADDEPPIWWGDPHVHTVLSRCHPETCRSLNFCYTAARYCAGLDWTSAADHVSNGRCDFSKWKEQATVSNLYNDPPAFATLPAYEASLKGGAGGDNNVYMRSFPDMFVDAFEEGNVKTLCDDMAEKLPRSDFFAVPHHTTRTGKHGEIPGAIYPGPQQMPVVEIHSKWGTSEYRGNPTPLAEIHPGPSYVRDLLHQGYCLGFIGGTDTHATMPAGWGEERLDRMPGLTAVRAPVLTRNTIFEGIRDRHCYAAAGERVLLRGTLAGAEFGQHVVLSNRDTPRKIEVIAAGKSDITSIDVICNGETVHRMAPGDWQATLSWMDVAPLPSLPNSVEGCGHAAYYYVRVTLESGARAWSSPVWVHV